MHPKRQTDPVIRRRAGEGLFAGVVVAAIALNAVFLALYHFPRRKRLVGDEHYYAGLARAIADGREAFHELLWPPFYGEWLGWLFTHAPDGLLAAQLVQSMLWIATALLIRSFTTRLLGVHRLGNLAGAFYLLSPEVIAFTHGLWPETLHAFFFVLALWLWACFPDHRAAALLAGLALAGAISTKLLLVPLIPFVLVFVALRPGAGAPRRRMQWAAIAGAALLVAITPTLLRNHQENGVVVLGDSASFNIWVGLNDVERVDWRNDLAGIEHERAMALAPTWPERSRILWDRSVELVRDRGVVATLLGQLRKQYFRLLDHESFLTTQLPGGPRSAYVGAPPFVVAALHTWSHVYHAALLAGLAFGLVTVKGWRRPDGLHLLMAFLAYCAALFLIVHVKTRYLLQLIPAMVVFVAIATAWFDRDLRSELGERLAFDRTRGIAGGAMALILLGLAFASRLG